LQTSAGPAFVALLGNKYGYRPFPAQIEQAEFEKLLASLESDSSDTTTLRDHFHLDLNAVPPCYVLKATHADDAEWWSRYEVMQKQLRDAAVNALTSHDVTVNVLTSHDAVVMSRDSSDVT